MIAGYLMLALFLLGIWGILSKRNLIKKVIALSLINNSIIIMFVYLGSLSGKDAPILVAGIVDIVDPIPQALMLTAIVVGICITSLALALVYKMYQQYHTLDIVSIERIIQEKDV
jgi:multicomponent Na+:H+ antiporter subunit C